MSFSLTAAELIILAGAVIAILIAIPWLHDYELGLERRCQHKHRDD